jgi:hypothetical protein
LFCKRFWCVNAADDNESRKRKRTANTKFFTAPFRIENFAKHVRSQHAAQFEEYSALTFDEKKSFFDTKKRVQGSIHRYMNASRTALMIPLAKGIAEVLIGEIFFKPELNENDAMMEPITKINALKLLHQQPFESYLAKVSNSALFDLVLKHMSDGLSFRKTSAVIEHHKESFGNGKLAGLNDHGVVKMVRFNVAANLQVLSDVLNDDEVWSFSLAGDTTTHQVVSFFDVRIRVCVRGVLHNVHLVCVPFYDRHKEHVPDGLQAVDNLCVSWRSKLISVSTDGENTMTGWIGGFVTLMAKEAVYEVLRVWCPPHQVDLVIHDATVQISDGFRQDYSQCHGAFASAGQPAARNGQQVPERHKPLGSLPGPAAVVADAPRPTDAAGRRQAASLVAVGRVLDHRRRHQPAGQGVQRNDRQPAEARHRPVPSDGRDREADPEPAYAGRHTARGR